MQKKLIRYGDVFALVIDKPVMDILGIAPDTPLDVLTNGETLIVTPVREEQAAFHEALEKTNRRYGKTLKKLAE